MVRAKKEDITVIIIDDHPVISHGLIHVLGKNRSLKIVGNAEDSVSALKLTRRTQPDVAILDISLENSDGISLISQLIEAGNNTRIIMYTMHNHKSYVARSLREGALGYILKSDRIEELIEAIYNVVEKKIYLSSNISPGILSELVTGRIESETALETLTPREYEIAALIAKGRTIDQIGGDLYISPKTVRVHRTNIMHKFECNSIHELLLQLRQYYPQAL